MNPKSITRVSTLSLGLLLAFGGQGALAAEREDLEVLRQTTMNLIQVLVQQGVLTQEKADQLVRQATSQARATVAAQSAGAATAAAAVAATVASEPGVVRVPYVPEIVRKQITDQVREEVVAQAKAERWGDVNAVPEWVDRIKIEGDMRVGYQSDMFGDGNAPDYFFAASGQLINNTTEDRNRIRMRARLGVNAKVTPELSAAVRLTTGGASDAVSTTQTLGTYGSKYNFGVDRAFLKYHSDEVWPWLTASAGRLPNPFFSSDLVWNENLNFEGVAVQIDPFSKTADAWRPFATLGAFPLQDIEKSSSVLANSKWMMGTQVGAEWVRDNDLRAKFGLAYYDYKHVSGIQNSADSTAYNKTAPDFRQKGNTLFDICLTSSGSCATPLWALASDYQLVNLTGMVDLMVSNPVRLILTADYVDNVGFNRAATLARTGLDVEPQTKGYMARATIGMPTMLLRDDWQLSLAYRYLEADAVLDAYTDGDFHLGGTNNKGFIVGGQYSLGKNSWLSARWLSSNEISGLPLSVNVLQMYFNAKF